RATPQCRGQLDWTQGGKILRAIGKNDGIWHRKHRIWPRVYSSFFASTSLDVRHRPMAELPNKGRLLIRASGLGCLQ
ncbi:hypothetical protein PanWU01x14_272080, partial [Parasponia andersonii]